MASLLYALAVMTVVYLWLLCFIARRVDGTLDYSVVGIWLLIFIAVFLLPFLA